MFNNNTFWIKIIPPSDLNTNIQIHTDTHLYGERERSMGKTAYCSIRFILGNVPIRLIMSRTLASLVGTYKWRSDHALLTPLVLAWAGDEWEQYSTVPDITNMITLGKINRITQWVVFPLMRDLYNSMLLSHVCMQIDADENWWIYNMASHIPSIYMDWSKFKFILYSR